MNSEQGVQSLKDALEVPDSVGPEVALMTKRVVSIMKKLPKGMTADNETLLELAKMNRHDRRSALARLRKRR